MNGDFVNIFGLFVDTLKQMNSTIISIFEEKNIQKKFIAKSNFINDFMLKNHLSEKDIRIMLEIIFDAYEKNPDIWDY